MARIHDNKVNKIYECNLLHYIINPPKRDNHLNFRYSLILHWCMNTKKVKAKFKNFKILLDSVCSSTIVMVNLVENYIPIKMMWFIGTRRLEISILILRLSYTSPYPYLARQHFWRGNGIWMNLLRVRMK